MAQFRHEPAPTHRVCSRCQRNLPLTDEFFYRDKTRNPWTAGAWRHHCRSCTRESIEASRLRKLAENPRYEAERSKRYRERLKRAGEMKLAHQTKTEQTERGKARRQQARADKVADRLRQSMLSDQKRLQQAIRRQSGLERHDPVKERIRRTSEAAARKRLGLNNPANSETPKTFRAPLDPDQLDQLRQLEILRDRHRVQRSDATATDSGRLPFGAAKRPNPNQTP